MSWLRMMLPKSWFSLSLLLLLFSGEVWAGDNVKFFARVVRNRQEVIQGDSCLVSFVLYSTAPFVGVESKEKLKVKNADVRRLAVNRQATVRQVVERGQVYYTMVWAQYVLRPQATGKLSVPTKKFKGVFKVFDRRPDPFDAFFGIQPQYHEEKAETTSEVMEIFVKEKPQRTTREILRSGGRVL